MCPPVNTSASPLARLQHAAIAYAAAKALMDGLAIVIRWERSLVPAIMDLPEVAPAESGVDRSDWLAVNREAVTGLDQQLAAAIATWSGTIFDLQAAAVAVVGIARPDACRRAAAQLQVAAQAYASAKADVDAHQGPPTGVVYASRIATWRGTLMDLDRTARAYAAAKPMEGQAW